MHQLDAGGNFVHILPAMPAGADKTFLDVRLPHAERGHALRKLAGFFKADGAMRSRFHGRQRYGALDFIEKFLIGLALETNSAVVVS